MAMLDEVDSVSLAEVLLAEERGVIIDFWGTWCQPCRTLRPHLEALADEYAASWRLVAVHVESHDDLVTRYRISSTPTLVFLQSGEEVDRLVGAAAPSTIAATMVEHAPAGSGT